VARIDYFNDPNAPKANSIVPSVTAIVPNERGELLLVHKTDNDLWALPGGGMDLGESKADTVVREVKEETGIDVAVTGVVGIHTNPHHVRSVSRPGCLAASSRLAARPAKSSLSPLSGWTN
jgi:8-oxo-dGTP pyrophosphatase MutT (NUDIX family)